MELGAPGRPNPDYWNVGEGMGAYLAAYERALEPVPSTIPAVDDALRGGFRPGVHFIGGNTGAGKSALCLWMAERMAQLQDPATGDQMGVAYISLELSMPEVRARLGSRMSLTTEGIEPWRWYEFEERGAKARAAIEAETYESTTDPVVLADLELMARCPNLRIVDGIEGRYADKIENIVYEIEACGARGGRVCFIDYLQCIDAGEGLEETETMKRATREINLAGLRAGVAVIVIAAVSRAKGTEMRKGKSSDNPGADIFRGSSWIEYTALTAFALVRRDDAIITEDGVTEVELHIVKNRRGACGEPVRLGYNGAYGEFSYE